MSAIILLLLAPALVKAGTDAAGGTTTVQLLNPLDVATYRDYPASALEVGVGARVRVKVSVDKAGQVVGCVGETLTKLDDPVLADKFAQVTCRLVEARGRFTGGVDEAGQAVGGTNRQTFAWRIPDNPKHVVSGYSERMRLSLTAGNRPVGCNMVTSLPDVDTAAWCRALLAAVPAEYPDAGQPAVRAIVNEVRVAYGDTAMPPSLLPSRHGFLAQGRATFTVLPGRGVLSCTVEEQAPDADPCQLAQNEFGAAAAGVRPTSRLRAGRIAFTVWEEVK